MHVVWDITVGNLITWAVTLVGAAVTVGRLTAILDRLSRDLQVVKQDLNQHEAQDLDQFKSVHEGLLRIAQARRLD